MSTPRERRKFLEKRRALEAEQAEREARQQQARNAAAASAYPDTATRSFTDKDGAI